MPKCNCVFFFKKKKQKRHTHTDTPSHKQVWRRAHLAGIKQSFEMYIIEGVRKCVNHTTKCT